MSVKFVAMCPACIYVLMLCSYYLTNVLFCFCIFVCALLCVLYMYLVALVRKNGICRLPRG